MEVSFSKEIESLRLGAGEYQVQQFVVGEVEQFVKPAYLLVGQRAFVPLEEALQHQVVLQQPAPGAPAQPPPPRRIGLVTGSLHAIRPSGGPSGP